MQMQMQTQNTYDYIVSLPKADLHVHLEGTVSYELLETLAVKNNVPLNAPVELPKLGQLTMPKVLQNGTWDLHGFEDFIAVYRRTTECIRTADDIVAVGLEYLAEAKRQNIKHSELYFSPTSFIDTGADLRDLFSGLLYIECCAPEHNTTINWIFDIVRNANVNPQKVIEAAVHARNVGLSVNAIGLGGKEVGHPASEFTQVMKYARSLGFTILAHAGETGGTHSVINTIDSLNPKRIGHGVQAASNSTLLRQIRSLNKTLEVSPCSNVCLKIFNTNNHPICTLLEHNVPVVLCSDDPGIFGHDLVDNYLLAFELGVSLESLTSIAKQSLSPHVHSQFAFSDSNSIKSIHGKRSLTRSLVIPPSRAVG